MKNIVAALLVALSVAGCTQTEQGAAVGAVAGGAIGAAVADDELEGALVGAAVGGAAGALIGRASEQPGRCYYRDNFGRRYIADCPRGY